MIIELHDKTTLAKIWHPLMQAPSYISDRCFICGKKATNKHHMVKRSAGELYVNGRKLKKPEITLCGSGCTGHHGLAHAGKLHFRWVPEIVENKSSEYTEYSRTGHLEYLITNNSTKYQDTLQMDGWQRVKLPGEQYE